MTNPASVLHTKLSAQAPIVRAAQAKYDQAVSTYRNSKNPADLSELHDKVDQTRATLKTANEVWEKLCDELLQLAGQEAQAATGNPVLDMMLKHAPTVLTTQSACKKVSDEYLESRRQNHPDQDKLAEINSRLGPAQNQANSAMQHWSSLCKELLQTLGQGTPPAEAAAPTAC